MPLSLSIAALALASASAFTVDTSAQGAPQTGAMLNSFGSSHAATTLRATWRSHFSQVLQDIPFQRVRFHGILDDDLSTLLNSHANGALVFDTLDFLVENSIKPTLELSFMPKALASNASLTVFHYEGGISMYKSEAEYMAFITELMQIIIARYGAEEVRSWRVEVWNEPNCGFWLVPNQCGPTAGNMTGYFQLYSATARAVKAADALVPVGGPATAMLAWLTNFTAFTAANGLPMDFVSSHLYPTDPNLPPTRDAFMQAIAAAAATAAAAGVPFYLTEFNAGLGGPQLAHNYSLLDSSFAAGFVLHAHLLAQAVPNLASASWWTFSDFGFEEGGAEALPWAPGHTKFGAMTRTGVPKPVYRGMQMLSAGLGAAALPVAPAPGAPGARGYTNAAGSVIGASEGSVDCLALRGAEGVLSALLANFDTNAAALPAAATVNVTFFGLPGALPAWGTVEYIDEQHANPMRAWEAAGSPLYPTRAQTLAELAASQLVRQPLALTPAGQGAVTATITLLPYAMARVTLAA